MEAASSNNCSLKNASAVVRQPSVDRELDSVLFIVQAACGDLQEVFCPKYCQIKGVSTAGWRDSSRFS